MADTEAFPYETHLNVHYPPLAVVDVPALVSTVTHPWYNQTLCRVNDSVVRLGVLQGEYHWHHHDDEDEFFFVLEGRFLIDLEDRTVTLEPQQGFVVPKGVRHRTRAPERVVILMVEGAGIIPTGGLRYLRHKLREVLKPSAGAGHLNDQLELANDGAAYVEQIRRLELFDAVFHAALSTTLEEWQTTDDEAAFRTL